MRVILLTGAVILFLGCRVPPEHSPNEWRKRTEEMGIIEELRVTGIGRNVNNKNGICSLASENGLVSAVFVETRIVACAYIVRMGDGARVAFEPKRERGDYQEKVEACTLKRTGDTVSVGVSRWFKGEHPTSVFYDVEGLWGEVILDVPSVSPAS